MWCVGSINKQEKQWFRESQQNLLTEICPSKFRSSDIIIITTFLININDKNNTEHLAAMADVKVQTPAKENRAGAGAQGGTKENSNSTPGNKGGNKGNNNPDKQNSAGKKRKMNHNGPPHGHQNQSHNGAGGDRGDHGDRMGGQWNPGPGGPQPFMAHRLTGAPAWDLPPQNTSSQTFTGMF